MGLSHALYVFMLSLSGYQLPIRILTRDLFLLFTTDHTMCCNWFVVSLLCSLIVLSAHGEVASGICPSSYHPTLTCTYLTYTSAPYLFPLSNSVFPPTPPSTHCSIFAAHHSPMLKPFIPVGQYA